MLDWLRRDPGYPEPLHASRLHSDARAVVVPMRGRALDPDVARRARLRRGAGIFFACAVFAAGSVAAVVGDRGWLGLERKREELSRAEASLVALRAEVRALENAVARLEHDPHARERIARERLDMAKPGEIVFLLPPANGEVPGHGALERDAP